MVKFAESLFVPCTAALLIAAALSIGPGRALGQEQTSPSTGSQADASKAAPASKKKDQSPGPWNDPADPTVWPNRASHANSDPWLVFNHDKIRSMHPRVLLINFSNEQSAEQLMGIARQLIAALAESSRYHGYADKKAPVFMKYEIFKLVDLRDKDRTKGDSRKVPLKNNGSQDHVDMSHAAYFSDQFAAYYKVPDPRDRNKRNPRWLRLNELVDLGYIHEVWYFLSGAAHDPPLHNFEVIELKPQYNLNFVRQDVRRHVQAGNGGDPDEPWTGRSLRIGYVNASRGVGCFVHSLGHGLEGTCNSGAIPYFSYYFAQYAGFDFRRRYGMPFNDLYGSHRNGKKIRYENNAMIVPHDGQWLRIPNYVAAGGNVHFPPNGREDYDDNNTQPVPSTIEDWRIGSGPGHRNLVKPFTNAVFAKYNAVAPDGGGAWQVYWRQNMPGLNNRQKDDFGRPMKNWWPFLFY